MQGILIKPQDIYIFNRHTVLGFQSYETKNSFTFAPLITFDSTSFITLSDIEEEFLSIR